MLEQAITSTNSLIQYMQYHDIDGRYGEYRDAPEACLFGADNDYQAIQLWLKNKLKNKPNTLRLYRNQTERLLMWAIIEKQKPISSLNHDDFEDYFLFLDNPQPKDKWCINDKKIKEKKARGEPVVITRFGPDWRPFKGPLSASAKVTAIHAISTMLNYWLEFGYLKTNMLKMIDLTQYQKVKDISKLSVLERALTKEEWQAMMNVVAEMPVSNREDRLKKSRVHFLLITLLITACRRQEIADMKWSQFVCERGTWRLYIHGKGNKLAKITLPDNYIALANQYREHLSLANLQKKENVNLSVFTRMHELKPITGDTINKIVKDVCKKAINYVDDEESKQHLQLASVHWIRHTAATVLDDGGVDKDVIKAHLRHESSATTELYIHKNTDEIKLALDKLVDACMD